MSYDPRIATPLESTMSGGDVQAALEFAGTLPVRTDIPNVFLGANGQVWDVRQNTDPTRQRAVRVAQTTDAFVALTKDLGIDGVTRVFADRVGFDLEAVIDFGTDGEPTRDEHRIEFAPRQDPEWQAWASLHGKPIDQIAFADFIEEHLDSVIEPDGADLLDIVQTIKGHRGIQFKTAFRLHDGQTKIAYDETLSTQGGSGEMTIPNTLTIRTPIFREEDPVEFTAYLRYRIGDGGAIQFTIKIQKKDEIVPGAFDLIVGKVDSGLTYPVYAGTPR